MTETVRDPMTDTLTDTVHPERHTFRFERALAAGPEAVFDAWTRPERIRRWWDPSGAPLVDCAVDLRVQGAFRFVTEGHAPPFEGVYVAIERPRRIVFDAMGARGTIALEPRGTGTAMVVEIRCADATHFETFLRLGVHEGTSVTMDNLVRLVASGA